MYYHLILTDECNLNCSYCRGKDFSSEPEFEYGDDYIPLPASPEFGPKELDSFLKNDTDPAVLFYGGEPILRPDLIRTFMDNMTSCRFSIYTNGILIRNLTEEYIKKFDTIILSIDGNRKTTDGYRGRGVYDRVMENLSYIAGSGFSGEIIGRITVAEDTDIFSSVIHLAENGRHPFTSIHWQIDANFWYDYGDRPGFKDWIENSYNPGIVRLAHHWSETMELTGKVPRWYPFCGLVYDILADSGNSPMRCGAGYMNYAIQTDGTVIPCPCMQGMPEYYCGNIFDSNPSDLRKILPAGECTACDISEICGGRCLYSNIVRPWPEEGRKLVYGSVLNLKSAVDEVLPGIREMIENGIISKEDFRINKYNGCEIIP